MMRDDHDRVGPKGARLPDLRGDDGLVGASFRPQPRGRQTESSAVRQPSNRAARPRQGLTTEHRTEQQPSAEPSMARRPPAEAHPRLTPPGPQPYVRATVAVLITPPQVSRSRPARRCRTADGSLIVSKFLLITATSLGSSSAHHQAGSPHPLGGKSGTCQRSSPRSSARRVGSRAISRTAAGNGFSPITSRIARSASNNGQTEQRGKTP